MSADVMTNDQIVQLIGRSGRVIYLPSQEKYRINTTDTDLAHWQVSQLLSYGLIERTPNGRTYHLSQKARRLL